MQSRFLVGTLRCCNEIPTCTGLFVGLPFQVACEPVKWINFFRVPKGFCFGDTVQSYGFARTVDYRPPDVTTSTIPPASPRHGEGRERFSCAAGNACGKRLQRVLL